MTSAERRAGAADPRDRAEVRDPSHPSDRAEGFRAVSTLYQALMTGLVLTLVTQRSADLAERFVFAHFRRQHLEKFLPGLQKLGLAGEPDAPACALYHYHSNALGGVKTGYLRESDRKAWVRYPPPRWIWRGTAIAAVPHAVSAAMLHGWHGHNGVSLGNPGLGFVCTGMTVDGMPGLEGYYFDHGRPLEEHERVRFAYGSEEMPRVDWAAQPKLETANWPEERRQRTFRAYALEYLRTMLPTLQELLGPADARTGRTRRPTRLFGAADSRELPTCVRRHASTPREGRRASRRFRRRARCRCRCRERRSIAGRNPSVL